jgi:LmbE family N-acetylglucosaminyl deacetylase
VGFSGNLEVALGVEPLLRFVMVNLSFKKLNTVLCLGAHSDDIEIGCGGTILKLVSERPGLNVVWVVFSADGRRVREAKSSALEFLKGTAKRKEFFEKLKARVQPDLVFTHYRDDRHQDHRVVSDLTWNTFRDHVILEFEIPKYDGDLGTPNLYIPLDGEVCRRKVGHICAFFQTQSNKHWFSTDTFLALMRLRGIECASKTRFAEAFYARKLIL